MYTTKPYSIYKNSQDAILEPPSKAQNSGYLVLKGSEPHLEETRVYDLPFPQNRILRVSYTRQSGENAQHYWSDVFFVPVVDQPLSANRYYVIHAKGKNKGKVYTSSKEEDMSTYCFFQCINDTDPKEFDIDDIYQQIEIIPKKGKFTAKSVAPDGFVPWLLRQKHWKVHASKPKDFVLTEALGFNDVHQQLDIDFSISEAETTKLDIGKWYSPFMFINEEMSLKDQVKRSAYYEIILEQFWEQVYTTKNYYGTDDSVEVKAVVKAQVVMLNGKEATRENNARNNDGTIWFKTNNSKVVKRIGLNGALWGRFKREEYRRGWVNNEAKINKIEMYEGVNNEWKKFAFYVLVERFVVKRMDGSLALTMDFKHTNKTQSKWE